MAANVVMAEEYVTNTTEYRELIVINNIKSQNTNAATDIDYGNVISKAKNNNNIDPSEI